MKFDRSIVIRAVVVVSLGITLTALSSRLQADTGNCSGTTITLPFSDVPSSNIFFCSIASAFVTGVTNGTTPTTYNPSDPVPREQMAAFVSRTLDQSVKRANQRAAIGQWWTNKSTSFRSFSITGNNPRFLVCDGLALWLSATQSDWVERYDIATGYLTNRIINVPSPEQIVVVGGYVCIASAQTPGRIYFALTVLSNPEVSPFTSVAVGSNPVGITYDGRNLWTANDGTGPGTGSISRANMDPASISSAIVTTFTAGFSEPRGILFDGANLWVTDNGDASLKRVDTNTGAILQTIPLSGLVWLPIFDGTNLWIPCQGIAQLSVPDTVYVVRGVGGLRGTVLAALTGNGLNGAFQAAFDGERICVTNATARSVSLWKATDLSPIDSVELTTGNVNPRGICSDGTSFFIGLRDPVGGASQLHRL